MPLEAGLIIADPFGAEIVREAEPERMAPASRRALLLRSAVQVLDNSIRSARPLKEPYCDQSTHLSPPNKACSSNS